MVDVKDAIKAMQNLERRGIELSPTTSATKILNDKSLFELLNAELDKTIVNEEQTRKAILLVALGGCLTRNAESTSLNLMIHDYSGSGKDYLLKSILKLLPHKWVVKRKRISPTVFSYWNNVKTAPTWTWDNKIFYNEDISNSMLNSDIFKVFSSAEIGGISTSTITIQNKAVDLQIAGKPCMLLTIAAAEPNPELLRRFPICNLDTSQQQTERILKRKAEFHKRGIKPSYDKEIMDALWWLNPVTVKVPFADKLVNVLDTSNIIIRTNYDRIIDYVKFSTAIHQYQRSKDQDGNLIATQQDYEIGRLAILKTMSNIFSIPLTRNQDKIIEIMKRESKEREVWFSVNDLEAHISFISDRQLRRELDKLTVLGFMEKTKEERSDSRKPVMIYKVKKVINIDLPCWENLNNLSSLSMMSCMSMKSIMSNVRTNDTNDINDKHISAIKLTYPQEIEVDEEEMGE